MNKQLGELLVFEAAGLTKTAADKKTKAEAGYVGATTHPTEKCANCASFMAPSGCKKVEGGVAPGGWCKLHTDEAA